MKNQEAPLFSVIVPAYNPDPTFLQTCIGSITHQTFDRFELILVDSGSAPEFADLIDRAAASDARIRVFHGPNTGPSSARNLGLSAAMGTWILFVDADDWLEPETLERLASELQQHPCDILMFSAQKEFENGPRRLRDGLENGTLYQMSDVNTRELLYLRAMGTPNSKTEKLTVLYYVWNKVYSRAFLEANHLTFPVSLTKSEDKVFTLQCFEKMETMYYLSDVFYHYRMHSGSICHRYSEHADTDRLELAGLLEPIAERMDRELASRTGQADYHKISDAYRRFCFGIISDVLDLKFYHPDYPGDGSERAAEVRSFLKTEPFRTAIRETPFSELSDSAKLKKFLLMCGMPSAFYRIRSVHGKPEGRFRLHARI